MTARRQLLYVSPIMPALGGNGLAMRGGMMLEALAADHDVWLLVVPVAGGDGGPPPRAVRNWCAGFASLRVAPGGSAGVDVRARRSLHARRPLDLRESTLGGSLPGPRPRVRSAASARRSASARGAPTGAAPLGPVLARFATPEAVRGAHRAFGARAFDEVHVFRLYLAPFADPYLSMPAGGRPMCTLDLDDHESRTRERLAALHAAAGDGRAAMRDLGEAARYRVMERHYLPLFDRVYVCSANDRTAIARSCEQARVSVVPNGVRMPGEARPARGANQPFTALFVANLSYYPNEDAAVFFCTEILPRLRAATGRSVRALIVGGGAGPAVRALANSPNVVLTGAASDLADCYASADVAVVPVRAGGGTRIKLLEALAHQCPVVSTSVGAEGIEARHDFELLIADGAADFAAACARVLERPGLARALARRGRDFVERRHSPAAVLRRLRAAQRLSRAPTHRR